MSVWTILVLFMFAAALMHAAVLEAWRERIAAWSERAITQEQGTVRVTMIVPVRNAEPTIVALLQDLYAQRYPKELLETIVVDDGSTDGTVALVEGLMSTWPQLRIIRLVGEFGKKAAITAGVEAAAGELILLTDADARCGPERVSSLVHMWDPDRPAMVLMPVRTDGDRTLLGRVQEEEQCALQGAAAGSGMEGTPALANGANMAFDRSSFFAVGGYQGDRWASGDDMFLLLRMRKAHKEVRYHLHPSVVVSVAAEPTWSAFFEQRLRWAGKMRAYRDGPGMVAGAASMLFPWGLVILTVFVAQNAQVGSGLFYTGTILATAWSAWLFPVLLLGRSMRTFFMQADHRPGHGRYAMPVAFVALLAYTVYAPVIALLSLVVRPQWKGRRT